MSASATNTRWFGLYTLPVVATTGTEVGTPQWLFGGTRDLHTLRQCFSAWFQLSLPLDEPDSTIPDKYDGQEQGWFWMEHLIRFGWNQEQG